MLTIEMAGLKIGIHNRFPHLERQCAAYVTDGKPDFEVAASPEAMETERARSAPGCSDGYLESIVICREIAVSLPSYDAFLFHAAVIEVGGLAYAFTAESGTGKSTHIRLWRRVYGDQVKIVNGDKPVLRFSPDGTLLAYGTPWAGKEGWQRRVAVPLQAVVFLERGKTDAVFDLPKDEAAVRIMRQILLDGDAETVGAELALIDRMLMQTEIKQLFCTPTENAARVAYRALTGSDETTNEGDKI